MELYSVAWTCQLTMWLLAGQDTCSGTEIAKLGHVLVVDTKIWRAAFAGTSKYLTKIVGAGCRDMYDFFYLPVDFKNRCNLGYAFVNFPDAADTVRCYEHFHGSHWEEFNSKKVRSVTEMDLA